ncbi:hypothetical protein, partial [Salinibacter phage 6_2]
MNTLYRVQYQYIPRIASLSPMADVALV